MRFSDVLLTSGLDLQDVAVVLHKTTLQPLRRLFPALVFEHPDLFDAYQSVHSEQATATLRKRRYMASFAPYGATEMLFVGIYEITGAVEKPTAEIYADPRFQALADDFGASDTAPAQNIARFSTQVHFTTRMTSHLADLRGRLQIALPAGRAYVRLAENLDAPVLAITPAPITAPPPPDWDTFVVDASMMRSLPQSWQDRLRHWRGVYLITDESDGARYVGSAYGAENLLGRWRAHVAGDQGVTRALRLRNPATFRFSILQLVSPTAAMEEVVAVENSWKERLHTRAFGLNEN